MRNQHSTKNPQVEHTRSIPVVKSLADIPNGSPRTSFPASVADIQNILTARKIYKPSDGNSHFNRINLVGTCCVQTRVAQVTTINMQERSADEKKRAVERGPREVAHSG
eukprot:3473788-Pyramimonas_sp.AAC.1